MSLRFGALLVVDSRISGMALPMQVRIRMASKLMLLKQLNLQKTALRCEQLCGMHVAPCTRLVGRTDLLCMPLPSDHTTSE